MIALCTDAFTRKENIKLCKIINETYNIQMRVTPRNRIVIYGKENCKKFLKIIGKPMLKCYKYKWNI